MSLFLGHSLSLGHNCSIASMVRCSSMQWSCDFRFFKTLNNKDLQHCSDLLRILEEFILIG